MEFNRVIEEKRIIIYGTGCNGKAFYEKYKDMLPVYACTSSWKATEPIGQIPVIPYEETDAEKDFMVICSISYEEIRRKLVLDGFRPYGNFLSQRIFETLYGMRKRAKRLIIGVGQCEISEICTVLSQLNSFNDKYGILYFDERRVCSHGDKFDWAEYWDCLGVLSIADYFIMPSVFSPKSVEGFEVLLKQLKEECQTIRVSLFDLDSYWPQDIYKERILGKYYLEKRDWKICAYAGRDQILEQFVEQGYSVKQIMEKIRDKNFFDKDTVLQNHKNSIRRAVLTDRTSDIRVADFIENNFEKVKLYCDRGHFNEALLREYAKRILEYLEENKGMKELEKLSLEPIFRYINELPIYPSTAGILGLGWITENTEYRIVGYDQVKKVTFDEYMEKMIQYYMYAKKTLECCYLAEN